MPVIAWVIIAILGLGAGTAVVVPAVVGDDEAQTAPADPQPATKTVVEETPIVIEPEVHEADSTRVDLDEPLPEKLPYEAEPLIPLPETDGAGGMTKKLGF